MNLFRAALIMDLIRMGEAALKNHDLLHPLIVHFPIALLSVLPVLIVLGLFSKNSSKAFYFSALILMVIGTVTAYLAYSSGRAAGELVDRTPEISAVLARHKEFAKYTRFFFTVLTATFAVQLFVFPRISKKWIVGSSLFSLQVVVFLAVYMVAVLLVMNTAHQGGMLVHQYGVHAVLPASF